MAIKRDAFFIQTPGGSRFAISTYPNDEPRGGLLYLHPFAEEMNKSRRMAALAACAFAEHGWFVLQVDLAGCGDSAGDFGAATWQAWLDDVQQAWAYLGDLCSAPRSLWTLRAGSLLAADWVERSGERPPLLLWQPVSTGRQHLLQFLRLKAANQMLGAAEARGTTAELRSALSSGRAVEVAGYSLSPELAKGLESAALRLPAPYASPVALLEVRPGEAGKLSVGAETLLSAWRAAEVPVTASVIQGPGFWQTLEIETAPELIAASIQALDRLAA